MLEHTQLLYLLSGRNDPLWICSLPDKARTYMGCSTGAVYLSGQAARHILQRHRDIDTFQLLLLPVAIQNGELRIEPGNRRFLNAIYADPQGSRFFVTMKRAANGHELWVQTMYRVDERKLRRKIRRSESLS